MQQISWLALGYNAPAEPSKSRVFVWRKLKECGAEYFRPGVALLPNNGDSMAKFRALASKIKDMGGEAVIVELRFCDARDEAETVAKFRKNSEKEYAELAKEGRGVMQGTAAPRSQAERDELLKKLVKRYSKVKARDYFSSRDSVPQALTDLADDMERVAAGLGRQLRGLLGL